MTATSERLGAERRGAPELLRPALVVGAAVLAVRAAQLLMSGAFTAVSVAFPDPWLYLASLVEQIVFAEVPFALGVFLTLWLVRPVSGASSVWRVIGTGVIATVGGGVLFFVALLIRQLTMSPDYSLMGRIPGANPFFSLGSTYNAIVAGVPLVVLGAVLLWIYQRRRAN